jgi:hypothetical protein
MSDEQELKPQAKSYKEHLLERIQTPDDALGYLNACHDDGPEAFQRGVQDIWEFRATADSARRAAEQIVRQMNSDNGNIHQMEIEAIIAEHCCAGDVVSREAAAKHEYSCCEHQSGLLDHHKGCCIHG